MRVLRDSSADEMVAEFLRAEINSRRFGHVKGYVTIVGLSLDQVERPNLTDPSENQRRAAALSLFRGWPTGGLFADWPLEAAWRVVALDREDLSRLYYAGTPEWRDLSGGSFLVADGARRLKERDPRLNEAADHIQSIRAIAGLIRSGQSFPLMLATGPMDGHPIVMAEGHARMTAYVMEDGAEGLELIHAAAPLEDLELCVGDHE